MLGLPPFVPSPLMHWKFKLVVDATRKASYSFKILWKFMEKLDNISNFKIHFKYIVLKSTLFFEWELIVSSWGFGSLLIWWIYSNRIIGFLSSKEIYKLCFALGYSMAFVFRVKRIETLSFEVFHTPWDHENVPQSLVEKIYYYNNRNLV